MHLNYNDPFGQRNHVSGTVTVWEGEGKYDSELCWMQVFKKKSKDEEEEQMRHLNVSKITFHFSQNNQI